MLIYSYLLLLFVCLFFQFLWVALAVLKLTLLTRLASNPEMPLPVLPECWIKDVLQYHLATDIISKQKFSSLHSTLEVITDSYLWQVLSTNYANKRIYTSCFSQFPEAQKDSGNIYISVSNLSFSILGISEKEKR